MNKMAKAAHRWLNEDGEIVSEEFIETISMMPDFEKGFDLILKAWNRWKKAPASRSSQVNVAKKELINYISNKIR